MQFLKNNNIFYNYNILECYSLIVSKTYVNISLLLSQHNKILMSLRKNTGYEDHKWSLICGNQENNESALYTAIREAREEIGININTCDLQVLHIMHRKTSRENIDVFIQCKKWGGIIKNKEPQKCESLRFYEIDNLPINTVEYIADALRSIKQLQFYSEKGWSI